MGLAFLTKALPSFVNISSLNLPTITGGRADFSYTSPTVQASLSCVKGTLYFASGFDGINAIASATTTTSTTANTTNTTTTTTSATTQAAASTTASTVSAQTAQPKAAKSGNSLVISSIPPGTYTVSNATKPS